MRLGWTVSGIGHLVLILVLLFGGFLWGDRIPESVTVSEVAVISEEEFAALALPGAAPEPQTDAPDVAPPETEEAPETPAADAAPTMPEAADVEVPEGPDTTDITVPDPVPDAVAVDTAPPVPVPPSEQDGTSLERDAVAAPAPRVAPVPQVATPEREVAPEVVEDTTPEPAPEPEPEPEPETPSAPEEASDRIVTEAEEEQNYAPASSRRPRSRPAQPVRRAETPRAPEPEAPSASTDDAVAAALSEPDTPTRSGPPLTGGEKEGLRVAVSRCWNVGSLSTDALGTTVVVAVEMEQSGKPISGSIRLVSSSGGSSNGERQAFEAARRAIIRCGANGFGLPVEKFDQWREIEMTFNPEGMQFR